MALGRISDTNLAETATLSGGAWSEALPLDNLQVSTRYVSLPARQLTPAVLSASRFDVELLRPRYVDMLAILFHTLSLDSLIRVTAVPLGGSLSEPAFDTGWRRVHGRWFLADQISYEEPNWWTGYPLQEDIGLYPSHLFVPLELDFSAHRLRVEIDDNANPAGHFDLGGLWVSAAWSPRFNFERGRDAGFMSRDLTEETPAGVNIHEPRRARRTMTVKWSLLSTQEARRLYDAGSRAGRTKPVLFIPDAEDETGLVREAFVSTFDQLPQLVFRHEGTNQIEASLKEIIA